ncbi:flagellin N-terminal helical domain-containing protein [Roseivivax sp. CAU 1753]
MSSILTNTSAMNALATMRNINSSLETTQGRISSGLKVQSSKDNAAYFQISETMRSDSSMYSSINEGLTMTKNSLSTARLGAENFQELSQQFTDRVAFAQGATTGLDEIEEELLGLIEEMTVTIAQSTFNGADLVNAAGTVGTAGSISATTGVVTKAVGVTSTETAVTGITRAGGTFAATTTTFDSVDLSALLSDFTLIATGFATNGGNATTGQAFLQGALGSSESLQADAISNMTSLGVAEKTIENQQSFLTSLVENIDSGIGAMVDANMEEEAARLQALQVQQQLATQSLSIANQSPQNILSLFR